MDGVADNGGTPCITAPWPCHLHAMERSSRITAILLLGLSVLVVTSWVRYHNPSAAVAARAGQVEDAAEQNAALGAEVRELERRIGALESGTRGMEREARGAFPLVEDGEILYELEPAP
jgi:cell division protein FtsB